MANAYDEIAYPPGAYPDTHPERLAVLATLLGLDPAPPDHCRVLEVGAGDGSNLLPMAYGAPRSTFVGFDLAQSPVAQGQRMAQALGLRNVRLLQADLLNFQPEGGPFDYIIAEGVHAWTPEPVRQALMRLLRERLAPHGIAYVSYNTLPGAYVRLAVRRELLFAARHATSRAARLETAMQRLRDWPEPGRVTGDFRRAMAAEAAHMRGRAPHAVAHDELNDAYAPDYLTDFAARCAESGLTLLADAQPSELPLWLAPAGSTAEAAFDPVAVGQEADFAAMRPYRQSLIVRADNPPVRRLSAARVARLHVSSQAARLSGVRYRGPGGEFDLRDGPLAAVLDRLGAIFPDTVPVAELGLDDSRRLALADLYMRHAVDLRFTAWGRAVGDRPTASPIARWQASEGQTRLTTLLHTMVDVEDPFSRTFIAGLDGSRTRLEIARDIAPHINLTPDAARAPLDVLIDVLGRAPLLIA